MSFFKPSILTCTTPLLLLLTSSLSYAGEITKKDIPKFTSTTKHEFIHVSGTGKNSYSANSANIGDKTPTTFLQQTQTTNVVTHQIIEDMSPQSMEDVIKYVPGISVGNSFGGTQDSLIKRGFGGPDDGSVLRNGIRMPIGRNFDSATTERVEFLKGPASLLYGMQEPGGVINVITKQPRKKWGAAIQTNWASLGGGYGHIDVGGPLSHGFEFRLIAGLKNENYWRNFGANKQKLIAPSLSYKHNRFSAEISYQWTDYHNALDRGAFFYNGKPISGRKNRLDEPWSSDYGTRNLLAGSIKYKLSKHDKLQLSGGWNEDNYHDRQGDPSSYNPTSGILTRRFRSNTGTLRSNSYISLDYIAEHRFLNMKHNIDIGGDYENRRILQGDFLTGRNTSGFKPSNPVYGMLSTTAPIDRNLGNYRTHINSASWYLKDNIHLGRQVTISPGVRYQWFHYSYGGREPFIKMTDASYTKALPFIGIVYQPLKNFSLYGDYSQSFNPNQLAAGNILSGGYKPTSGRQFEVGARYQNKILTADLALYNIHKKNVQQVAGLTSDNATIQRLSGLVGSKGIEAEITGHLSKHLNILTNYAYTYARTMKDTPATEGKQVYNVAKHTGAGYLTYQTNIPWHQSAFRIGAGARYVGRRPGDIRNTFWLPGYTTIDMFASWKLHNIYQHSASLQVNAENITNKAYFTSTAGTANRVSWGQGRTIRISVGMEL